MKLCFCILALLLAVCTTLVGGRAPVYWEEQVLAYQLESSFLSTKIPRGLQATLPLNQVVQPYAHNAFNGPNLAYVGDPFKRPVPSMLHQIRSIPELLDMGIRHISLEVHWIQQLGTGNELHVCRTPEAGQQQFSDFCTQNANQRTFCNLAGIDTSFGSDTGCWRDWNRPVSAHLAEIDAWLSNSTNANEFVHIQLVWRLNTTAPNNDDNAAAIARVDSLISSNFGAAAVLRPAEIVAGVWPSLNQLRTLNKRVVISCVFNCPSSTWVHTNLNVQSLPATFLTPFVPSTCCQRAIDPSCNTDIPQNNFYYIMEDLSSFANVSASTIVGSFTPLTAFQTLGCNVHAAFDAIDYPMAGSLSWTWAPSEPTAAVPSAVCAFMPTGQRQWRSAACSTPQRHACRNAAGVWQASTTAGAGNVASPTCPSGFTYVSPRSPQDSRLISELAASVGVNLWINAATATAALARGPAVPPRAASFTVGTRAGIPVVTPRPLVPVSEDIPRFCSLPQTSLFFDDCDWPAYGQSVASRTAGLIALACIGLVISCIFGVIITCCCLKWIKGKKKNNGKDIGEEKFDKRNLIFLIPTALIIAGSISLLIGNRQMDVVVKNFTSTLRDRNDQLGLIKFDLDSAIANLSLYDTSGQLDIAALTVNITDGFDYLQKNIKDYTYGIDSWNLGRNIVTVSMPVGALFWLIFGFVVMIKKRHRLLIMILICVNFVVFLSFVTVLLNALTQTISKDMCYEVDRPAGLFDVLQSKALLAMNQLTDFANKSFDRVTIEGCNRLDTLCSYGFQVCQNAQCNIDLLSSLARVVTLNDNGTSILLLDCPRQCTDPELRRLSADFSLGVFVYDTYIKLMTTIQALLLSTIGEPMRDYLKQTICADLSSALPLVYTGGGLLMVGLLVQMALHFWLGWK